jgi:hypothetical protein
MSQENAEVVRSLFEPFDGVNIAAIDWGVDVVREALGEAYSPDVELTTLASGIGTGVDEFYRGADGVVRYLREWLEPFSEYYVENLDYIDAGDYVLVPSHQWGVGGASSPPSTRSATARSRGFINTTPWKRLAKPPGCRSRRWRRRTSADTPFALVRWQVWAGHGSPDHRKAR